MSTQQLVFLGVAGALAFLLMATLQIPVLPQAPYLRYDPSDAVALLAGVVYGPGAGVAVVLVKDLLYLVFRARGPFGPLADFIAAATFVAATAWTFRRTRGSFGARLLGSALAGTAARVLIMIPANFVILHLQFGLSPDRVQAMLLPILIPFNALKAAANAVLALVVGEPFLRRTKGIPTDPAGRA
ncbi:MAG: ECF transporter S component [Armatimonadota bacterium]|nr:ECF transporter S component [Armatimonadota bacterium]MDR7468395.1 ECF transporter S component [Armatimonadota bacterium]MDR7494988.1 ECF transporter S component [Armatimonadota bacterium]MDR7548031.1 ECF transporter S component [Armatimonadota bacterium]MDR7559566.1 ECF transporter S component [Armatimonadota bacterium]